MTFNIFWNSGSGKYNTSAGVACDHAAVDPANNFRVRESAPESSKSVSNDPQPVALSPAPKVPHLASIWRTSKEDPGVVPRAFRNQTNEFRARERTLGSAGRVSPRTLLCHLRKECPWWSALSLPKRPLGSLGDPSQGHPGALGGPPEGVATDTLLPPPKRVSVAVR